MVDRDGNELSRDTESTPTGGPIDSPNIELLRDDLIELLYGTIQSTTEFIFDDSIATLQDDGAAVEVTFVRSGTRTFDFLIGADGLHSNVRRKVFGPEEQFIKRLGTYAAIFTVPNFLELDYWQKWHYGDNTWPGSTAPATTPRLARRWASWTPSCKSTTAIPRLNSPSWNGG